MNEACNFEEVSKKVLVVLKLINPSYEYEKSHDFFEDHFLDSMDVVRLIASLDSLFDINIISEDIIPENIKSISAICNLVNRYQYES